jgi:hypothetical protein
MTLGASILSVMEAMARETFLLLQVESKDLDSVATVSATSALIPCEGRTSYK